MWLELFNYAHGYDTARHTFYEPMNTITDHFCFQIRMITTHGLATCNSTRRHIWVGADLTETLICEEPWITYGNMPRHHEAESHVNSFRETGIGMLAKSLVTKSEAAFVTEILAGALPISCQPRWRDECSVIGLKTTFLQHCLPHRLRYRTPYHFNKLEPNGINYSESMNNKKFTACRWLIAVVPMFLCSVQVLSTRLPVTPRCEIFSCSDINWTAKLTRLLMPTGQVAGQRNIKGNPFCVMRFGIYIGKIVCHKIRGNITY